MLDWLKGKPKEPQETAPPPPPMDIAADELAGLTDPHYIVDLRDLGDFRKGHVKGAHQLSYMELSKRTHELPSDRLIIIVDQSSRRGRQAAKLLRSYGFDARNLKGGIGSWTEKLVR